MPKVAVLCEVAPLLLLLLVSWPCGNARAAASAVSTPFSVRWLYNLTITMTDGVVLHADAVVPVPTSPSDLFPLVIFPNSWGCPEVEYITRALGLGERGYVALEYETRGWYNSGGEIDTAGPLDIADAMTVLDFAFEHAAAWQADTSRVAFMGISYGAGISLMTAASDSRVTTAIAMSGWNNLTQMFYAEHTPNSQELEGLLRSASSKGNPSPDLFTLQNDMLNHRNMSFAKSFGDVRSPQGMLSAFNARRIPLLLSCNYLDRLFRPQYMMQEFFPALVGPKMLLLNQGPHAFPEGAGLFLNSSYIWNKALLWLEYYLQNITTNGIPEQKPIQMQLGTSIFAEERLLFDTDPSLSYSTTWYLSARGDNAFGSLSPSPPIDRNLTQSELLYFGGANDTALSSGYNHDSEEAFGLPFLTNISGANRSTTLLYLSEPMVGDTHIFCGTANLSFSVQTNSLTGFQVYGFLYAVDPSASPDLWQYITDFYYTQWHSDPASWYRVATSFHTVCQNISAGFQLGLGIVMFNGEFLPATSSTSSNLRVLYSAAENATVLSIPFVPSQP